MAKFGIGARVVDLLGRQQVAGAPTAINELFKNAHDAYADHVVADLFRQRRLLIIRDDGVGMSQSDFESRWLTAATDSKRRTGFIAPPPTDPDKKPRPVMGEKGIGRLAIAVLGDQVLVLTKEKTAAGDADIVAALVNWGVFELPNLVIDDIMVPVRRLAGDLLPDAAAIDGMTNELSAHLDTLRSKTDPASLDAVMDQVAAFKLDPRKLRSLIPTGPSLEGPMGSGTHFYIAPTTDSIAFDIDEDSARGAERSTSSPMQQVLLGFSNTMKLPAKADIPAGLSVGPATSQPMKVAFWDHVPGRDVEDIISENEFWSLDDFARADHHISGSFDSRGQFTGTIRIYGSEPRRFTVPWPSPSGRDTRCGAFDLNIGYLQGNERESRLKQSSYQEFNGRLSKIGGIYIYKDDIRILPYGNLYDFLGIEERRSRSASYYFFAYRRMFGYIDIDRSRNSGLSEKAGREGFQENVAYKEFKSILKNFFIQVAAEFFRSTGESVGVYEEIKSALEEEHKILEKRQSQVRPLRKKLGSELASFFEDVGAERYENEVAAIVGRFSSDMASYGEGDLTATELMEREREARAELSRYSRNIRISRPRGLGLTRDLSRNWAAYQIEIKRLEADCFSKAHATISKSVSETESRLHLQIDQRRRALDRLEASSKERTSGLNRLRREVSGQGKELADQAGKLAQDSARELKAGIDEAMADFQREAHIGLPDEDMDCLRGSLENRIEQLAEAQTLLLRRLQAEFEEVIAASKDGRRLLPTEVVSAMEAQLEEAQEREAENLRLAQMGQAIGIVHHEFASVIRSVRRNIRRLGTWAKKNPQLDVVYNDISDSYRHLDSYLGLFTPLNRNLSGIERVIEGADIDRYLRQLFDQRLSRHEITLQSSDDFLHSAIVENVANIYPCFVNIVDNAIFWIEHRSTVDPRSAEKSITLDFHDHVYSITDTGPGVPAEDRSAIFESGFSRKPSGSGLGLHITKSLLDANGYDLRLAMSPGIRGARFEIAVPAGKLPTEIADDPV